MTTTTSGHAAAQRSSTDTATRHGTTWGLTLTGGILLGLGLVLGSTIMFDPRPYSEISATTAHTVHYAIWVACLVALSQLYPRLAGLSARPGRAISAAAATAAGVGAALDACARFMLAFVNPVLAEHAPDLLDTPPDAILLVPTIGVGVVAMVGVVWLAVSAAMAGVVPRAAAALLAIGAVAIPAAGPLSNVLVGAALVWFGIAAKRRARS